jgi:hypothetical protein
MVEVIIINIPHRTYHKGYDKAKRVPETSSLQTSANRKGKNHQLLQSYAQFRHPVLSIINT